MINCSDSSIVSISKFDKYDHETKNMLVHMTKAVFLFYKYHTMQGKLIISNTLNADRIIRLLLAT